MPEGKPKIVMFEDDTFLSGMYKIKFEKSGFEVKTFEYPPENVVDIVAAENPDLISMNIIMPKMDGFHLAEVFKADSRTKSIPLVFLTSLGQIEDLIRGFECGAIEYLIKGNHMPGDVVEIYKKILAGGYKTMWTKEKLDKLSAESLEENKVSAIEPEEKIKSDSENFLKYAGWAFVGIVVIGLLLVIFTI